MGTPFFGDIDPDSLENRANDRRSLFWLPAGAGSSAAGYCVTRGRQGGSGVDLNRQVQAEV
jgi:hypothetical protein